MKKREQFHDTHERERGQDLKIVWKREILKRSLLCVRERKIQKL